MSQPKKIAIDFDDTYTAMPEIWDAFIIACKAAGHSVTIVTARFENKSAPSYNYDISKVCELHGIDVVYCEGDQKSDCFEADIWIDDAVIGIPSEDQIISLARLMKVK